MSTSTTITSIPTSNTTLNIDSSTTYASATPSSTTPASTTSASTTPASTTSASTTSASTTSASTKPASTTSASTTSASTKPASTTSASTTSASTTSASTTSASTTSASTKTVAPLSSNSADLLKDIFTKSNIIYLLWFLAIYLILYFILGVFFNKNANTENNALRTTRILDGLVFLFVLLYIITSYSNTSVDDFGKQIAKWLSNFKDFAQKPYSIFSVLIFIAVFYFAIYLVRIPMTSETKPISIMLIESVSLIVVVILTICDFFKYLLNIDLIQLSLGDLIDWFKLPTETISPNKTAVPAATQSPSICKTGTIIGNKSETVAPTTPAPTPDPKSEVFNIRNNIYTYDEAKTVCSIYGAKLATYDQVEEAYNLGGEWCNYGWSDGQMALFPTQKETWKKLQDTDKSKNACGRPGVNGGYIKNKNVRFGVNCFGKKPKATDKELEYMKANVLDKLPETEEDRVIKAKIDVLKKNPDKFLLVNSFNRNTWSEF